MVLHSGSLSPNNDRPRRSQASRASMGSVTSETAPKSVKTEGFETSSIKVVARIRPKLPHELLSPDGVEALQDGVSIQLTDGVDKKTFTFDDVIDSRTPEGSQSTVFDRFGRDLMNHSMRGYNVCIFAYGHTGSGKTHTILGYGNNSDGIGNDSGILPRFISEIYEGNQRDLSSKDAHYSCDFYEVYNEEIRDLLAPLHSDRKRTVHAHPKHGVRIEGLSSCVVASPVEALGLLTFGNQMRTVAATTMNERSSRSHAIFTFRFEKSCCDALGKVQKTQKSAITFVDLAGREDQEAGAKKDVQFREMCYINTSLFHLAHLISKISDNQVKKGTLADFRNSKLTLLLSQALIGNSRTGLIATVAPLKSFFEAAQSTLHFAQNVKKIKTKSCINNKTSQTCLQELEMEIRKLRKELNNAKSSGSEKESELLAAQSMVNYYKQSWEELSSQSAEHSKQRKRATTIMGLADSEALHPQAGDEQVPFFAKLTDDPALQGCCNFILNQSCMSVGSDRTACAVILDGVGIRPQMCEVLVDDDMQHVKIQLVFTDSTLELPRVLVGGHQLKPGVARDVHHGDTIILGYAHALRLCIPSGRAMMRMKTSDLASSTLDSLDMASALTEIAQFSGAAMDHAMPFLQSLGQKNI